MSPIAQQIIADINEGKCFKEMGLRGVVESRVATAGMLMHKNPLGRDNRARERGPHRSQEQVEILKEFATREGSGHRSASNLWPACNTQR